jgi:hypothetical protein
MFTSGDSLEKYYTSAAILNRIEYLFKRNTVRSRYKGFKYHLVFMLYSYYVKVHTTKGNADFEVIARALDDDAELVKLVNAASQSIETAEGVQSFV